MYHEQHGNDEQSEATIGMRGLGERFGVFGLLCMYRADQMRAGAYPVNWTAYSYIHLAVVRTGVDVALDGKRSFFFSFRHYPRCNQNNATV